MCIRDSPKVLLVDEDFARQDEQRRQEMITDIKKINKDLGLSLIHIYLTEKGAAFMHCAQNILSEFEKMKRIADNRKAYPLKIASAPLSEVMSIFLDFLKSSLEKLQIP